MVRKLQHLLMPKLFGVMLVMCTLLHPAMGQSTPVQSSQLSSRSSRIRPLSIEHLYWHFLILQNFLDAKAADQESVGKDGSGLRNNLQKTMGFSDADYAPVRSSSVRLSAKVKDLNAQALAIRSAGRSASGFDQLKALTVQREEAINSERSYLKQNLSTDKIKQLEAFLTQFFSPANASPRPSFGTRKPALAGVQK